MGATVRRIKVLLHTINLFLGSITMVLDLSHTCILRQHSLVFVQFVDMVIGGYTTLMFVLVVGSCAKNYLERKTEMIVFIMASILNLLTMILMSVDYPKREDNRIVALVALILTVVLTLNYIAETLIILLVKEDPDDD